MCIDLHTHSTASDGTMSATELVEFAKRKGLKAIAITDHDTFDGIPEALEAGEKFGIEVLPGIELSVNCGETSLHLLGYLFDYRNEIFSEAVSRLQQGRIERNIKIIARLADLGLDVNYPDLQNLAGSGQIGRPHIAKLIIAKGGAKNMDEAFDLYLGKEGKAYCKRFTYSLAQAVDLLRQAGGVSIVAHPSNILQTQAGGLRRDLLMTMISRGIDGVEVYYPTHTRKFRNKLISFIQKHDLIMTGGSDYHGDIRPGTTLAGGKNVSVPVELLEAMKQYRLKKYYNKISN